MPGEMVGRFVFGMAGDAIHRTRSLVVEVCRSPGRGGVTDGTLPGEMIGGFIFGVARGAVGCTGCLVIKAGWFPGIAVMAGSAVAFKMWNGFHLCMTAATGVRSPGILPVDVAILTSQ